MPRLILASSSPRRRELLAATGLAFTTARPDIDETPYDGEPADQYVARLCGEKAAAIQPPETTDGPILLLTADTTVALDGNIIGKPVDPADATAMLAGLRDRAHFVHTGIALRNVQGGAVESTTVTVVTTQVVMRPYTDAEIAAYVASGEPYDKAGGYAVQDAAFRPVAALEGCATNVMGLPLCAVGALLAQAGITMPTPPACSQTRLPCAWRFTGA